MVIQHNIMSINSHRQLTVNNGNLSKNLEKLSSGYRVNRAADDAAGLAISQKMRAQITGLDRAVLNAQDGSSLIQTAEGALTEVHSMLNRMVELATESANGTIQSNDRQKIESEVTALKSEINRISDATNFNGINLLDGTLKTGLTMQVGDTAQSFNKITVKVNDMDSAGLGIASISVASQASSAAALTSIKAAIETVSSTRGDLGALQNRLEHTIQNLGVTSENMTAAESRVRDVDMAKEMMAFTKNNVLAQAAQSMLAQANQQPQQVLQLLR